MPDDTEQSVAIAPRRCLDLKTPMAAVAAARRDLHRPHLNVLFICIVLPTWRSSNGLAMEDRFTFTSLN